MSADYTLRIPDSIVVLIRKMHPQLKRKICSALDAILQNPMQGKSLKLELAGLKSYRVGRFRIIYRIGSGKIIELVAIGSRKTIYEYTYSLMRQEE